jgi:hypothetical protein
MTRSRLDSWKEPNSPCSICGRHVTLELSKTDEVGQAVHEFCYVRSTLATLRSVEAQSAALGIPPVVPVASRAVPELDGTLWKAFEFVRW